MLLSGIKAARQAEDADACIHDASQARAHRRRLWAAILLCIYNSNLLFCIKLHGDVVEQVRDRFPIVCAANGFGEGRGDIDGPDFIRNACLPFVGARVCCLYNARPMHFF